jgi:hypothetical protein
MPQCVDSGPAGEAMRLTYVLASAKGLFSSQFVAAFTASTIHHRQPGLMDFS